jgi:hypothetical protein
VVVLLCSNSWLGRQYLFQTWEPLDTEGVQKLEQEIKEVKLLLDEVDGD